MEILSPLIVLFFSVSTMVLCFVCAFLLEMEYRKRHLLHLRFFMLAQVAEGLAQLSLFSGQAMALFGHDIGKYFIDPVQGVSINLAGTAAALGVLAFMRPGRTRSVLFALTAIPFVIGTYFVVTTPPSVFLLDGFPVAGLTLFEFFTNLGPLVLEWLLLIGVGIGAVVGRVFFKKPEAPHLTAMSYAGVFGFVLIGLYIAVTTGAVQPQLLGLSYLLVPALMASLFAGAVSFQHDNPVIARQPWRVFSTSVFVKIGIVNAALFLLGGFVLIGGIASFYDGVVRTSREAALRSVVEYETHTQDTLEREMTALVQAMAVRVRAERLDADADPARLELVRRTIASATAQIQGTSLVALVSPNGVLDLYGSSAGINLVTHRAVTEALAGRTATDVVRSEHGDTIETAYAVPLDAGSPSGVAIVCIVTSPLVASSALDDAPQLASVLHRGTITLDGNIIFEQGGEPFSPEFAKSLPARVGSVHIETIVSDAHGSVVAHQTERSGTVYYAFVPVADVQRTSLSIVFAALTLALFISALMAAFELYSVRRILSPIRHLVVAARRMEKNDLTARVEYASFDEVGTLATAFNAMAGTIEERTARLNELLRQQKDFLVNAAEDLRNPLNHFRWGLETMRYGEAGTLTPEQRDLIEQMHLTSLHLEQTVQNIIDTEKLSDGKMAAVIEQTDVVEAINDVAGQYSVRMHEKRIDFVWAPPPGVPQVMADAAQLRRVIGSLLDNAVKYTDPGGKVSIAAKLARDGVQGTVTVTVTDTGRGIPTKDKPFIFSKFFRAGNVARQDIEGTGLGLYIAKKLVALHGGRMWFVTDLGKGTSFSFTVPVASGESRIS